MKSSSTPANSDSPSRHSLSGDSPANDLAARLPLPPQATHAASSAPRLSRRWLTISLVAVTLIPVALAATVWYAIPAKAEPELPVEVSFEPVAWPRDGRGEVRLMPGVRLHNPSDERWQNISMAINSQFYFYSPEPLEPRGDFSVPLAFFKTSGNQAFRPTMQRLRKLTIYAQLPSGKRAIRDLIEPGT